MYFMVFQSHFGIHEGNVPASGIFLLDVRAYGEIVFLPKRRLNIDIIFDVYIYTANVQLLFDICK